MDRIVELTPEIVGKSDMLVNESDPDDPLSSPEIATANVYGQANIDRGMPGRLFRGVKRLLGNPSVKRLMVFDRRPVSRGCVDHAGVTPHSSNLRARSAGTVERRAFLVTLWCLKGMTPTVTS